MNSLVHMDGERGGRVFIWERGDVGGIFGRDAARGKRRWAGRASNVEWDCLQLGWREGGCPPPGLPFSYENRTTSHTFKRRRPRPPPISKAGPLDRPSSFSLAATLDGQTFVHLLQ